MTPTPPPVSIAAVPPQALHSHWPLIERGLKEIQRRLGPRRFDWQREDIFSYLRAGVATAYIFARGDRILGFFITQISPTPFSGRKELFLWSLWALPLRERRNEDNWPEVTEMVKQYIANLVRENGCYSAYALSSRKALARFGWTPELTVWRLWL